MTKKRVLFLEAGRREELISKFHDLNCLCYSYELNDKVPLPNYVRILKAVPWKDDENYQSLLDVLFFIKPDVIVPCSCVSSSIVSILSMRPSETTSQYICLDKRRLESMFRSKRYYPGVGDLYFGDIVIEKPRFGNSGKEIRKISSTEFVQKYQNYSTNDKVYQKFIKGKEYSVDCFCDQNHNLVEAVPRERLRVAGGEVIESITVENPEIIEVVKDISKTISLTGPICMQFIQDEQGRVWLIEINHRFGGGSTLAIAAGMNAPLWMLNPETCKDYKFGSYKRGLYLTRNYRDYYYET